MLTHDQWTIRRATTDDAAALAPLVQALAAEEGYAQPPRIDVLAPFIGALIADRVSDFFLAVGHGTPIGCLQLTYRRSTWSTARYGYIEDFYLVPAARSQGIGTAMIDMACAYAQDGGCAYVELDVRPENSGARRLYERLGFKRSSSELWRRTFGKKGEQAGALPA